MVNIAKLQEVFNTMSYEESCKKKEWVTPIFSDKSSEEIGKILYNHDFPEFHPNRKYLTGLAKELEKNVDKICEIEFSLRGILVKDTKKAVDILAQYFYYYAGFTEKVNDDVTVLGIFKDDHPIWILGLLLGPALASGFTVILQTGLKFAGFTAYIIELAENAGLPKNVLLHITSYTEDLEIYDASIAPVFFADIQSHRESYGKHNTLSLISQKAAMVVFQDADLDSAVENAVEAVWSYQGMLPWSVNTILIQESVFEKFTDKFTKKVKAMDSGDIACPSNPEFLANQAKTVSRARSLGIEVFQKDNNGSPTIIIGSKVSNLVFTPEQNDGTVTLVAFRSIEEAVNLANNRRQGLGASVWSENIGLVNEVARKLNVGNVWINGHGLLTPEITLYPLKGSGNGGFGGLSGLAELIHYTFVRSKLWNTYKNDADKSTDKSIMKAISAGNNALSSWRKMSSANRRKVFNELYDFMESKSIKVEDASISSSNSSASSSSHLLLIEKFLRATSELLKMSNSSNSFNGTVDGYCVASVIYPDPVGIFCISTIDADINLELPILSSLLSGNCVIVLTHKPEEDLFFQEISTIFPTGLLTVIPFDQSKDQMHTIYGHSKVYSYTMVVQSATAWQETFTNFTITKNIWSNIGQSHTWSA